MAKSQRQIIRKSINERMLLLMRWAIDEGLADNESDFSEKINFPRTNLPNVRNNHQGFTTEHILMACKLTGASADFIFGFTNQRLRKPAKKPMELLHDAVKAIDIQLRNGTK